MATYIPGSQVLGFGFNVFGTYDADSKTSPLFDIKYKDQKWKDYIVPENVSLDTSSRNYGETNSFSTRQKIEEHFGSKLSVTSSYGFFSGQFEASFNMTTKSDISYEFGLVETYSRQYSLALKDRTASALGQWVKDDPDYQNIPDTFTPQNRELFFNFFNKYGIYFMSEVILGARLFYSCAVSRSYGFSETDIKTKLELEYKVIFSAKATAEANWKKATENWANKREVKVSATGGDNGILNVLLPGFGSNHEDALKAWLASAERNPAVIDFRLTPISQIFSGAKATAVQKAMQAYVLHKLIVESKTGTSLINFNGKPLLPPADGTTTFGFQMAAINRSTLKPEFQRSYSTNNYWSGYDAIYTQMLNDIKPYNNSQYIIIFTSFSAFALTAPNSGFAAFLQGCGAYTMLRRWLDTKASNYNIYSCCALAHTNYAMVGIPGSPQDSAHEDFERAGSCDTGAPKWDSYDGWLGKPADVASVTVDIYLLQDPKAPKAATKAGKPPMLAHLRPAAKK